MPLGLRLFLCAAGLFCVIVPAWEFRHAFLEPSLLTVFFGVIVAGAWSVGGAFIVGALFGEAQVWRLVDGRIYVARRSPFIDKTDTVHGRDVESVSVRQIEWDSRPHTFAVVIRTKAGASYESSDVDTREKAEALAAFVRVKLKL